MAGVLMSPHRYFYNYCAGMKREGDRAWPSWTIKDAIETVEIFHAGKAVAPFFHASDVDRYLALCEFVGAWG